jgi:hypothetical protein
MELARTAEHGYDCGMSPTRPSVDLIARLKITLDYSKPVIWRRVEVPLTASLQALHEVIQAVMLFENYHLFQFEAGPRGNETRYGIPDPDGDFIRIIDARNTKLGKLVDAGVKRFAYTYDFGDDWQHTILVEAVAAANPTLAYPRFIDGTHRAPPEDVGGQPGFEHFLSVMADPTHPEHADIAQWYGGIFDPKDISEPEIATRMGKLAKRRALGKAAFAKSRGQIN